MRDAPFDAAEAAARDLRRLGAGAARIAVVLGSGLAAAAVALDVRREAPYSEIAGFPATGVEGHEGRALVGELGGRPALVLSGRLHGYEGHPLATVVHPVRAAARLGVEVLVLTCAAGGIREDLAAGAIVLVRDHLNPSGEDPLRGSHDPRLGPRFPSLVDAYDPGLRARLASAAAACGIAVSEGVYARTPGPAFETPAEIRALRLLGADLVGMSVVPETIAARQAGLRVAAVAVVTNRAAGLGDAAPSHEDVLAAGAAAAGSVGLLLARFAELGWEA